MKTKAKVHPHLKAFIHGVVMAEMSEIGPSKSYQWKENLMRQIQTNVLERLDELKTQGDVERITLEETQKVQNDFIRTLDMVKRTLQQVPVDILKKSPDYSHR